MTSEPDNQERVERLIDRTLRDLPHRPAPRSLERRVLAEIQRRAALPWWRRSFVHWPVLARVGFIVLSAGLVKTALMLGVWMMAGFGEAQFQEAVALHFGWVENGLAVVRAITGFFEIMMRNIPPLYLYAGLASFAAVYFTLFGLGAAAYKALHVRREN